jgi:hypothetical protein
VSETFVVNISSSDASVGPADDQGTVTIQNDDK